MLWLCEGEGLGIQCVVGGWRLALAKTGLVMDESEEERSRCGDVRGGRVFSREAAFVGVAIPAVLGTCHPG